MFAFFGTRNFEIKKASPLRWLHKKWANALGLIGMSDNEELLAAARTSPFVGNSWSGPSQDTWTLIMRTLRPPPVPIKAGQVLTHTCLWWTHGVPGNPTENHQMLCSWGLALHLATQCHLESTRCVYPQGRLNNPLKSIKGIENWILKI